MLWMRRSLLCGRTSRQQANMPTRWNTTTWNRYPGLLVIFFLFFSFSLPFPSLCLVLLYYLIPLDSYRIMGKFNRCRSRSILKMVFFFFFCFFFFRNIEIIGVQCYVSKIFQFLEWLFRWLRYRNITFWQPRGLRQYTVGFYKTRQTLCIK